MAIEQIKLQLAPPPPLRPMTASPSRFSREKLAGNVAPSLMFYVCFVDAIYLFTAQTLYVTTYVISGNIYAPLFKRFSLRKIPIRMRVICENAENRCRESGKRLPT